MSKEAVELVENQLNGESDELDFERAVEMIKQEQGVKEKTAASYIYEAKGLTHEWTPEGEHIVKEATAQQIEQQTLVDTFDGEAAELEMEPGEPTGDKYESLDKLENVGHPLVPDSSGYYRRRIEGHKTDVQLIARDLASDSPAGEKNVLLKGLPGVGKNALIKDICANTNRPMVRIPIGGGVRYEDLVGHYTPTPDGGLEWKDGILTAAVRYGWVVVLDEINMMNGDVSSPLHQITESPDDRELIVRQTGEVIKPHPQFRVTATMNPNFAGSKQMNKAFASRFEHTTIPYLSEKSEIKVVTQEVDGLDKGDIESVVDFASDLRDRYPQEFSTPVTTREIVKIGDYLADGFMDTKAAIRKVLLPMVSEEDKDALTDEIDMRKF